MNIIQNTHSILRKSESKRNIWDHVYTQRFSRGQDLVKLETLFPFPTYVRSSSVCHAILALYKVIASDLTLDRVQTGRDRMSSEMNRHSRQRDFFPPTASEHHVHLLQNTI